MDHGDLGGYLISWALKEGEPGLVVRKIPDLHACKLNPSGIRKRCKQPKQVQRTKQLPKMVQKSSS